MKKCSRCGTEITSGQLVCPECGKPQRQARLVRCRKCGSTSSSHLEVCPHCGEPLEHDWLRPVLWVAVLTVGVTVGLVVAPWLRWALGSLRPAVAVSTVQAVATQIPVLVQVPTLTPSLTPSPTPTATDAPTVTPTPSLTPTPTPTAAPTDTPTATPTETSTPTPTRLIVTATPTVSATPQPTVTQPASAPPSLEAPNNREPFFGEDAIIKFIWRSTYSLQQDDFYELRIGWTQNGAPASVLYWTQDTFWFLDASLHLRADLDTGRAYQWSVRLVRRQTNAEGNVTYTPLGPASEDRTFFWQ